MSEKQLAQWMSHQQEVSLLKQQIAELATLNQKQQVVIDAAKDLIPYVDSGAHRRIDEDVQFFHQKLAELESE